MDSQQKLSEFLDSFDANFPYDNPAQSQSIIEQAQAFGSDGVYAVLYELAYIPRFTEPTPSSDLLLSLVDAAIDGFDDPVKDLVVDVVRRLINGYELTTAEALSHLELIRPYKTNHYGALAIIYTAIDDTDGAVENRYNEIVAAWKQSATRTP